MSDVRADAPAAEENAWTPAIRRAVSIALFRKNLAAAAALVGPAAETGIAEAQYCAALLCENGADRIHGRRAAQWYLRAAEQNFALAQGRLGALYIEGQGVPQNYVEAYTWLSLAAANGVEGATAQRDRAASFLTEQALAKAQQWTASLWEDHVGPAAKRRRGRAHPAAKPEPEPLLPPAPQVPSRPH